MNVTRIVFPLVIVLALVTVADLEAGIFGRRRERIKAEVSAQLRWEMTNQVAAAKAETAQQLQAETTAQIAAESTALKSQVDAALVDMRESAKSALAAEAEKLKQETAAQLAKLRAEAEKKLAAETDKMKKQIDTAVAQIKQEAKSTSDKLSAEVKAETAKVAAQVEASLLPKLKAAMMDAIAEHLPKPPTDGKPKDKSNTAAVVSPPVRIEDEPAAETK